MGKVSLNLCGGEGRLKQQRWLCCKTALVQLDAGEISQDGDGGESRSRTILRTCLLRTCRLVLSSQYLITLLK